MGVVSIDLTEARTALAEAGAATSRLFRSIPDPSLPVPGLDWTARETALHLVGLFAAFTAVASGDTAVAPPTAGHGIRERVAAFNARFVGEPLDADSGELAERIERAVSAFLASTADREGDERLPTPWYGEGHGLDLDSATCLLLAEQLVHAHDLAGAARRRWQVNAAHARLAVHGPVAMIPACVDPHTTAQLRVDYRITFWGGASFAVMVDRATARVVPASTRPVDCHIWAQPAGFLLLCFGRKSQSSLIASGRIVAWGRKPWLGLRLKSLFLNP